MLNVREIEGDVNHRIKVGWMKWGSALSVISDRKILLKLKGKFHHKAIRPMMLYETQCRAVKGQKENDFNVTKMKILC